MANNNNPDQNEPIETGLTNAEETFFSGTSASSSNTSQSVKNKWLIPGIAFASAALLAGALGFALGNNNSHDMRPVAMAGQAFGQDDGQGREMNDQQGREMNDQQGHGKNDQQRHGKNRGPGQMNSGDGQKLPHCHDVSGNDVKANADGTCVYGSTPGFMGGQNSSPAPTVSSSPTVQ
jgi:hypothetical protein